MFNVCYSLWHVYGLWVFNTTCNAISFTNVYKKNSQFYLWRKQYFSCYVVVVSFIGVNQRTRRKPEDPEKTRGPGENQRTRRKPPTCRKSPTNITTNNVHNVVHLAPLSRFELTTSVVIGTDCRGCCKSNYHTITATTAPEPKWKTRP